MNSSPSAMAALKKGTIIPATPLALTEDKRLDEKRQRLLMRYFLDAGAGGIATAVHSTQFEIHGERSDLLEPVLNIVAEEITSFEERTGKTIVRVAGVCGEAKQAVREAEQAKRLGYDAVLLSPSGLKLSEEDFLLRAAEVTKIMPVIGFALQTSVGGTRFSYDYWLKLCGLDNLVAIKAAPFDRYQTLDIVRAAALSERSGEISLYTGNDDNIAIDLLTTYKFQIGGRIYEKRFVGGLLGHYSVWTKKAAEQFEMFRSCAEKGELCPELLTLAAQITDCNGAFFDATNKYAGCISGIHEVLRRQGLLAGIWCISDKEKLSPGQAAEIDRVYAMYPELNDDDFVKENMEKWNRI